MFLTRRFFISLFIVIAMSINVVDYACADTSQTQKVEQKRVELRQKINSLAKLEKQESNKLSRNQQKLERNQRTLKNSQNQYEQKQKNIEDLQKELNTYLKQYNIRQKSTAERLLTYI